MEHCTIYGKASEYRLLVSIGLGQEGFRLAVPGVRMLGEVPLGLRVWSWAGQCCVLLRVLGGGASWVMRQPL